MAGLLSSGKKKSKGKGKSFYFIIIGAGIFIFYIIPLIFSTITSWLYQSAQDAAIETVGNVVSSSVFDGEDGSSTSIDSLLAPFSKKVQEAKQDKSEVANESSEEESGEEKLLIPVVGELDWESLENEEVVKLLDESYKSATELIEQLDIDSYPRSRFRLATFIADIEKIKRGEEGALLSAEELLFKTDFDDAEVSKALGDEKVSRDIKMEWKAISLAPLFRNSLSKRMKEKLDTPYDPHLRLTEVEVLHEPIRKGQKLSDTDIKVSINGYIIGEDTKKMEWYVGDKEWETKSVPVKKADKIGRRYFLLKNLPKLKGQVITLRSYSEDGIIFQKRYNFYPKIRAFRPVKRKDKRYTYDIPFDSFDPRLDGSFLVQQSRINPAKLKSRENDSLQFEEQQPYVPF